MGIYYFNGSSKELLCQDHSIGAILAKYGVTKTFTSFVAFSALSAAPIFYLSLSASKWRREALLERNWVKINLNSSDKDLSVANEVIAAKIPRFGAGRTRSGSSTGFGFTATKKS